MKVISYYLIKNGDEKKEYLVEHVKAMINLLNNHGFKDSRAQKFGEMLYRSLNLISTDFKSSLLQTAVVLHDIGKAFYGQCLPKSITEGYLSFTGHEIISTVITWYAIERLTMEQTFSSSLTFFMKPVIFAVLYHHHAMDIEKRLQESIYKLRSPSEGVKDLEEDFKELKIFIPRALMDKLLEVLKEIERKNYGIFISDIARKFKSIKRDLWNLIVRSDNAESLIQKKLSLLALSCLISLDYIAASKLRDQNISTTFGKVIEDFYEIYCRFPSTTAK